MDHRLLTKIISTVGEEVGNLNPRLALAQLLLKPLPPFVGSRLRMFGLRLAGFEIGHGTQFWGMPIITGTGAITSRLHIGKHCLFNIDCIFDLVDTITIKDHVVVGHQALIITGSHVIGPATARAGALKPAPVVLEQGVWLGARVTILPGVTVGAGAVIGAGTVVARDVPANTLIAGSHRRVLD
ncbi:acyltransferase [Candidatus Chloroploca sp. M-50]|uniref:Acyltransferase n=1 Tax=Candidatus Chloroploca mongolica TaxID=2528176 RepID=A0ABS4DCV0_9CHLR|nr:DapH/DapD/GlmU-related protein [Candidatus Chloroploca mongolica]MBP1467271.1 acyltransferase [Candidatus Chloroploca mongolica]